MLTKIKQLTRRYVTGLWQKAFRIWKNGFIAKLSEKPLDAEAHLDYAQAAFDKKKYFLAFAELKTAEWLGVDSRRTAKLMPLFSDKLPVLENLDHNQYFRFKSLASEILLHGEGAPISVLDVGGGEGGLAAFIPDAKYCLAEPTTNGISGIHLPFADRSFDFVVSCHVFEHVLPEEREKFLDQLMSKAKRGVILLNPFQVEDTCVDERLKLVIDITGAAWAKEHLECRLPKLSEVDDYAKTHGLRITSTPNGTMATSLAYVFLQHFAREAGQLQQFARINHFFNRELINVLDSSQYPNAYLVFICRTS